MSAIASTSSLLSRISLSSSSRITTLVPSASFSSSSVVENKLKTHQGTAKRWRAVSNGSFKRAQAGKQHLNSSFSPSRINRLSQLVYSSPTQSKTLRRLLPYSSRSYSSSASSTPLPDLSSPSYSKLQTRQLLSLTGPDSTKFLKGLVSKDVEKEGGGYSGVLNASGRVLHDIFIYPLPTTSPSYIIEHSSTPSSDLPSYLKKFILRSKIRLNPLTTSYDIYSVWGSAGGPEERTWKMGNGGSGEPHWSVERSAGEGLAEGEVGVWDLRGGLGGEGMGRRVLVPTGSAPSFGTTHEERSSEIYDLKRMILGVPEGPEEIVPGQSLPMESCMDVMGGIDFRKGCYVGQELTVRTYHTGFTRKRIMPLRFLPSSSSATSLPPHPPIPWPTSLPRPEPNDPISYLPPASAASQKPKAAVKVLSVHPEYAVGLGLMRLELVDRVWGLGEFGAVAAGEGGEGRLVVGKESEGAEWDVWAGRGRGWYEPGEEVKEE